MNKVVFITGTSSGIGLATAKYFYSKGWNVVATMRNPTQRITELHRIKGITILHLDVCDEVSMKRAILTTIKTYGKIDVLINNAGYGLTGSLDSMTRQKIEESFQTNIIGLIDLTRLIIPYMKEQRYGTIINISSMVGKISSPFYSIYCSTKHAIEGFSECLAFETEPFGIKVKIIEPGFINTDFYRYNMIYKKPYYNKKYEEFAHKIVKSTCKLGNNGSCPLVVAETIYKASNSNSNKLRYTVGSMSKLLIILHFLLPRKLYNWIIIRTLSIT